MTRSPSGELECSPGEMGLSQNMEAAFRDCFIDNLREPACPPVEIQQRYPAGCGGDWFCPGCGVAATEDEPWDVRCPQCHKCMFEFLRRLVELHPHARR